VVLLYAAFCAAVAWRHRARRRAGQAEPFPAPAAGTDPPVLVAFASQTGRAELLARQTAQRLAAAGVSTRLRPLGELGTADLQTARRALFVVSTTGEGEAPDNAAHFAQALMPAPTALAPLQHAVLALGDRAYADFCGFGRRLDGWLRQQGSRPLFERIEMDDAEPGALQRWQAALETLTGQATAPPTPPTEEEPAAWTLGWESAPFETWHLAERSLLNPGSAGGPCWRVALQPPGAAHWEPGDLVEVLPPGEQRPRQYSVASLPGDGMLELIVRQERRADGSLGAASGWLTAGAGAGKAVALRLRPHPAFRIAGNAGRPLVLVGNGSGWAGLRSHLKARATQAPLPAPCWLLFGERASAHDRLAAAELAAWQASGVLARVDLVFSRDTPERRYVQHHLLEERDRLRDWLERGAAIYVCGSAAGMGAGVDQVLRQVLGDAAVEQLTQTGRYRRDVY
jgi:sulfite reductase (NADPH) flavoprotein alpha-component